MASDATACLHNSSRARAPPQPRCPPGAAPSCPSERQRGHGVPKAWVLLPGVAGCPFLQPCSPWFVCWELPAPARRRRKERKERKGGSRCGGSRLGTAERGRGSGCRCCSSLMLPPGRLGMGHAAAGSKEMRNIIFGSKWSEIRAIPARCRAVKHSPGAGSGTRRTQPQPFPRLTWCFPHFGLFYRSLEACNETAARKNSLKGSSSKRAGRVGSSWQLCFLG